jgi:two-component system OmpR family sensor kinase
MGKYPNLSGLVVAGVGFFLTRFTVTLAISQDPLRFYLGGVVPLALGLGLAAFGVALAVANVDPAVVRTTALWCLLGTGAMLVLVVLTVVGSTPGAMLDVETLRSQTYLSNFLIGGAIGGTLTGLYAARNRRQRRLLRQQRNRLEVLNRLLRHEVLNAVTAIRGYATLENDDSGRTIEVVQDRSADIEETIEEVKYLTRQAGAPGSAGGPIDLAACLEESVATVTSRYPDAAVSLADVPSDIQVRADGRLSHLFTHLLENAIVHGGDDQPSVAVETDRTGVHVTVRDDGPGLPADQRDLLETGDIDEFDNPKTGFGLNLVRIFVETYGGTIDTDVDGDGTGITVTLPRVETDGLAVLSAPADLPDVGRASPHLLVTLVAAVFAGVFYGIVSEALGGSVAGIGVFYGEADPIVGWITHEFHSVVFGFAYLGILAVVPDRYRDRILTALVVGIAWAGLLWLVAAGMVGPVWLRLLGIPASIPTLTGRLLASHLVWGLSLALLTLFGVRYVLPRVRERLTR